MKCIGMYNHTYRPVGMHDERMINTMKEKIINEKMSTGKVLFSCFLCLLCLSVGQIVYQRIQCSIHNGFGNLLSTIIYIGVVIILMKIMINKYWKMSLSECRITLPSVPLRWIIVAIILPAIVFSIIFLLKGEWIKNDLNMNEMLYLITDHILIKAICAGIVEEIIFRGAMLTVLEKKWGMKVAVIIPSIIFTIGHLGYVSIKEYIFFLVIIAGISVGIMFSLITYESGTIWSAALVHMIWNCFTSGEILSIGRTHNESSIYSYVLQNELLTGGDYVDASIISIIGYIVVAIIAYTLIKQKRKKAKVVVTKIVA